MSGEWISVKEFFPPYQQFVEVIYPDKNLLTHLCRDFAAYVKDGDQYYWSRCSLDENEWSGGFGIKYWRPMKPDLKGRIPHLKIEKSGFMKIYLKKVDK